MIRGCLCPICVFVFDSKLIVIYLPPCIIAFCTGGSGGNGGDIDSIRRIVCGCPAQEGIASFSDLLVCRQSQPHTFNIAFGFRVSPYISPSVFIQGDSTSDARKCQRKVVKCCKARVIQNAHNTDTQLCGTLRNFTFDANEFPPIVCC